ncbi:MAG TPA: hypothetical protein VIJ93_02065, partial [bacterium]
MSINAYLVSDMPKKINKIYIFSLPTVAFLFFYPVLSWAGLLWNPPRGTPGDLWADLVLGQTDGPVSGPGVTIPNSAFGERKPNQATSGSVFNIGSLYVDRSGGAGNERLYVWDAGNSRVLGFSNIANFSLDANVAQFGYNADIVLGQPDFSHCACNGDGNYQNYPALTPPNASQLCGMGQAQQSTSEGGSYSNMASDSQGNLYVPDGVNNRVLRFDKSVMTVNPMGPAASHVWGQNNDFTGYLPNQGSNFPTNASLNFSAGGPVGAGGVAIDSQGNLWVADNINNRVLRFPNPNFPNPGVPSQTADLVLGQTDFNSTATSVLVNPIAVRVDRAGNVFVADGGARILVFPPQPAPNGTPVIGG